MDEDEDYSSEDIEDIEVQSLAELRSGKLQVKNSGGTLRCPYSPSRKKQAYPYKDLLQHAEGVAKGKRGGDAAGKHRALCTYLKTDLVELALPPVERVHKLELVAPQREVAEDLLVYPWSGVVFNIDNKERSAGLRVGPGVADIRQHFAVFHPEKTHVFWGPGGHLGMAVLTFLKQLEGFKDAQAFEKWFMDRGLGRKDWERRRRGDLGTELYGWLARKEDYEGRGSAKEDGLVAKYLQDNGDLKDVGMVGEEMNKIQDQRFKSLAETVSQKNTQFQNLLTESEVTRRNAEFVMLQLAEKHKKELEEVTNGAKQSTEAHTQAMREHNQVLQSSMEALQKRCKTLEDKEKNMKNQADRTLLEQEKTHNRRQLDIVHKQSKMQKKHHTDQLKLIKKHEEESKKLEVEIQQVKLRLAKQHRDELELQREWEKNDTEKFMEFADSFNVSDEEIKSNTEGLETKLKAMEEQRKEYEEELVDLKEENESHSNMIGVLINQHRTVNDELEEARKLAVLALTKYGNGALNVKRMGEIDPGPWSVAHRQRKNSLEDWEVVLTERLSQCEELLKNPNFHPFKMVKTAQGKDERKLDENNVDLAALKSEFGEKVFQTVVTALYELEEYNPSGRYAISVAWNFEAKRRATMEEVIRRLMDKIKVLEPKKKGVKRNAASR